MARKFTSEEMREIADELALVNDEYHRKASAMLFQYADLMEREDEREKRYEYARVLSDGSISCTHFDEYVKGYYKFRREVGEWEEVSDDRM